MNQYNKNLLKKNFQDWAIFSIINNTRLNDKTVMGWKIIAGKKVTVEVVFHILRKFRKEIVIRAVSKHESEKLMNLIASGQDLNFYLPDDLVLFQSKIKHIEVNGDIRVSMPDMLAQVDRRKDLRFFTNDEVLVEVLFKKENHEQRRVEHSFSKKLFDISAGGSSFIISKMEKKFFKEKDKIENFEIKLGKRKIALETEVVSILEEKPNKKNGLVYESWKVCLRHRYSNPGDKKTIEDFVFRFVDFSDVI